LLGINVERKSVRNDKSRSINCITVTVTVTCTAPHTERPRAHHRVSAHPGARKENQTEKFTDHDETSPSMAAVSAPSAVCSMLAVQQQKRLCCQLVDVSGGPRHDEVATR